MRANNDKRAFEAATRTASPAQFYCLPGAINHRKTVDKMPALLQVLDCDVEATMSDRNA